MPPLPTCEMRSRRFLMLVGFAFSFSRVFLLLILSAAGREAGEGEDWVASREEDRGHAQLPSAISFSTNGDPRCIISGSSAYFYSAQIVPGFCRVSTFLMIADTLGSQCFVIPRKCTYEPYVAISICLS